MFTLKKKNNNKKKKYTLPKKYGKCIIFIKILSIIDFLKKIFQNEEVRRILKSFILK